MKTIYSSKNTKSELSVSLEKFSAKISVWKDDDDGCFEWCLFGTTRDKNGWETDNFTAETVEDALADALDYLTEYNS